MEDLDALLFELMHYTYTLYQLIFTTNEKPIVVNPIWDRAYYGQHHIPGSHSRIALLLRTLTQLELKLNIICLS